MKCAHQRSAGLSAAVIQPAQPRLDIAAGHGSVLLCVLPALGRGRSLLAACPVKHHLRDRLNLPIGGLGRLQQRVVGVAPGHMKPKQRVGGQFELGSCHLPGQPQN